MQCCLVASWGWKGPQEITEIQIFSFPIQFPQFKNNQPAFCPAGFPKLLMSDSPCDPRPGGGLWRLWLLRIWSRCTLTFDMTFPNAPGSLGSI